MRYVIKNCDNYTEIDKDWTCRSTIQNRKGCYNCSACTDCVMKQIVEKCKNNQKLKWQVGEKPEQWISFNNPSSYQILQLLDIQEVE